MRECGILLPITSIPSPYGIGGFSKAAYDFVDWLREAGQQYWQVLPFGPTGYGDSPYQSFGAFAGNPYFIDLDTLAEEKLLTKAECLEADCGQYPGYVDYERIYKTRYQVLRKAFARWKAGGCKSSQDLCPETEEYCVYMAVKDHFQGKSWAEWEDEIRLREPEAMAKLEVKLEEDILFYRFLQLKFQEQWKKLKAYANGKGIRIIGDIPIYVAFDSADSWFHPELFQFNAEREPDFVAGCPPDGFSPTGQLWGNPLYRWDYHKKTGYDWWIRRMAYCFELCDVVRVDHFRGFDEYYAIPAEDDTAAGGHWEKGPGNDLLDVLKNVPGLALIAEDLGDLDADALAFIAQSGLPGMKVLVYAFDPNGESAYLPHNCPRDAVMYTGTHDTPTFVQWLFSLASPAERDFASDYLRLREDEGFGWGAVCGAWMSPCRLAIAPLQDLLGLGADARVNAPGTSGALNWSWRVRREALNPDVSGRLARITRTYRR